MMDDILYDFIVSLINKYYTPERVFFAYQNGITYPDDWNMVLITRQSTSSKFTGYTKYKPRQTIKSYSQLNIVTWQVDLYGDNANSGAVLLHNALNTRFGADILCKSKIGVGVVRDVVNLTTADKKDDWILRYVVNFELMETNIIEAEQDGFDNVEFNIWGVDSDFPIKGE